MRKSTPVTVPAVSSYSRHLDRPFPQEQRTVGPVHIADVLPEVLPNLTAGQLADRRTVR